MRVRDMPLEDQPKQKLRQRGAAHLSDSELLSLFLSSRAQYKDPLETAQQLLKNGRGLRGVLDNPINISKQPETRAMLSENQALLLTAALELSTRHHAAVLARGDAFLDPASAARYFSLKLRASPHEIFAVLFLDTRQRALHFEEMFRGTIDGAEVHPREIVRRALECNAAAVIIGHNHPSGNNEPSAADRAVTQRLKQALALVDIRLLDHFVVGDGPPISLAARGWV